LSQEDTGRGGDRSPIGPLIHPGNMEDGYKKASQMTIKKSVRNK